MLLNAHHEAVPFTLPRHNVDQHWERLFDTAHESQGGTIFPEQSQYPLEGRSVAVFRTRTDVADPGAVVAPVLRQA